MTERDSDPSGGTAPRYPVAGVLVSATDYEASTQAIIGAARAGSHLGVTALAVHGVMTGHDDAQHRTRLNALDLVVPDGQPVRWALNHLHGTDLADRVYGPNLMLEVCRAAESEGLPIYLYGSSTEVLAPLAERLSARFPDLVIAGMQPSRFRTVDADEQAGIAQEIRDSGARICFVGLGCPRQEVFVYEHRDLLPMPVLAVGAAFDFHAGTVPQAPRWMQDRGLEWTYRLFREPRRLWRRYAVLNPRFLRAVWGQKRRPVSVPLESVDPERIGWG